MLVQAKEQLRLPTAIYQKLGEKHGMLSSQPFEETNPTDMLIWILNYETNVYCLIYHCVELHCNSPRKLIHWISVNSLFGPLQCYSFHLKKATSLFSSTALTINSIRTWISSKHYALLKHLIVCLISIFCIRLKVTANT